MTRIRIVWLDGDGWLCPPHPHSHYLVHWRVVQISGGPTPAGIHMP